MTENNWIRFEDQEPEKDRDLYYFFKYVGVWKGRYYGDHVFASEAGWLTGDVTHWQYDNGQEKPEITEKLAML